MLKIRYKKMKIAAFITKKIENNCLRKAIILKRNKRIIESD